MEKISLIDYVRNDEVLLRVNEQRNILREIRKRKANWIGHTLRRNCLLKQVIEGKIKGEIEVTNRQRRRRKKLLDDLKDRRGYSHLMEEALDRNMWRDRFGRGFEPVVWQTTGWWWLLCLSPNCLRFYKCAISGLMYCWHNMYYWQCRGGTDCFSFVTRHCDVFGFQLTQLSLR